MSLRPLDEDELTWQQLARRPFPGITSRGLAHQRWSKPLPVRDSVTLLALTFERRDLLSLFRQRAGMTFCPSRHRRRALEGRKRCLA